MLIGVSFNHIPLIIHSNSLHRLALVTLSHARKYSRKTRLKIVQRIEEMYLEARRLYTFNFSFILNL